MYVGFDGLSGIINLESDVPGKSDDPDDPGTGGNSSGDGLPAISLVAETGQTLCYDAAGTAKNCLLASD